MEEVREYTQMNANKKKLSERVIGCAFRVSNELGAGFLESVYEYALAVEMKYEGQVFERQKQLEVFYRGELVGSYVADFVVDGKLILELKALAQLTQKHEAQVMNYLKATGLSAALLLNFGVPKVTVRRIVRGHDDSRPV